MLPAPLANGASQPWSHIIWPAADRTDGGAAYWADPIGAIRIPAVSRATALYSGLIKQMAMDAYRGTEPLPRPRLLDRPDPGKPRSWWQQVQVEDYLWHGNALSYITARSSEGAPLACQWIPAAMVSVVSAPGEPLRYVTSWGEELPAEDLIHVRRGADRWAPNRGIGVIQQHLATLERVRLEESYETSAILSSGVPSVAVIVNNPNVSREELRQAKADWESSFVGPDRRPAFLPYGSTITPLGWSPEQSQLVEARKMSLQDVANAFGLDGYWLGAEASTLTYRSPGPMYLTLLRTSLEGVVVDFEQAWGEAWLPRGQALRFDRLALTREDFSTAVTTLNAALSGPQPLLSWEEARQYLGLPTGPKPVSVTSPTDTEQQAPEQAPEPEQEPEEIPA